MNYSSRTLIILSFISGIAFASDRKVLLEMFTNSHCYSCVAGYEVLRMYNQMNAHAGNTSYIFYHILQPGLEDSIYYVNKTDSDNRNAYYGPYFVAPLLFVDGTYIGGNTKTWESSINSRFTVESPFEISLGGTIDQKTGILNATASVTQTGSVAELDLRVHIVLTENVYGYVGKNGVTPQTHAMRKMMTGAQGAPYTGTKGQKTQVTASTSIPPAWDKEKIFIIAFVQSMSKRTVYQSEPRSLTLFTPTGVEEPKTYPASFSLEQNYPNPFNPVTTIRYSLQNSGTVKLDVTDVLGNKVQTLIDGDKAAGVHTIHFDASAIPSGVYFYRLQHDGIVITRRMTAVK